MSITSGVAPATYTYDARNRLTGAGGLTYTYDSEDRRVALTDGTGTTQFAINPNALLSQVLIRTAPNGTQTFYVYGLGLVLEQSGSVVEYYHFDRRGDTVALTNGAGTVTDRASYGVYGEVLSRTGITNTPFLFNGLYGVQSDSNDLYYHRARYYHPSLRRFLNQDSVLGGILNPASLNRFAYANGNPVSAIDPFGLYPLGSLGPNNGPGLFDGVLGAAWNGLWSVTGGAIVNGYNSGVNNIAGAIISGQNGDYTMALLQGTAAAGNVAGLALTAAGVGELVVAGGSAVAGALTNAAENTAVQVGDYTLSDTVAGHMSETVGGTGTYSGQLARPYLSSPSTIDEIISTGQGVPDPQGVPGLIRYDVPGTFRGSDGTWELLHDPATDTIYHFNFTSGGGG